MQDINNFANLMDVVAKNFDDLKSKLMAIPVPAKLLKIDREPTGKYYAVVQLDRPDKKVKPPKKMPDRIEVIESEKA